MEKDLEEEFVPYKLRTELIELGYDVLKKSYGAVCYHREDMKGHPIISEETAVRIHGSRDCLNHPAILYRQAFRWFRDNYDLHHKVEKCVSGNDVWYTGHVGKMKNSKNIKTTSSPNFSFKNRVDNEDNNQSYESTELACLRELVEIVKNR